MRAPWPKRTLRAPQRTVLRAAQTNGPWRAGLHWGTTALAGVALAWGVCWPLEAVFTYGAPLWWLSMLALGLYCGLLRRCAQPRHAFATGWVFATAWLCATFWWLFISMHRYGGLPAWMAVLAVLALAAALGLWYACAAALVWRLRRANAAAWGLGFAVLWTMAELARGTWFTGFGWGASGYAQVDGPLAVWAPVLGSYGVATLAAWMAATGAAWLGGQRVALWLRAAMVALLVSGWGLGASGLALWSQAAGALSVTLLQGNIAQDEKFESNSGVPQALDWYAQALQRSHSDLVVAPETAIPLLPQDLPPDYWQTLRAHFASGNTAALLGIPLGNPQAGYTNSALGLRPHNAATPATATATATTNNADASVDANADATNGAAWRYDKHHLVPFGEFIPPLFKWFTQLMHIPLGDFNRGVLAPPPFVWKGYNIAAHICYEDLFGEELAARFAQPAQAPHVLVNLSNIAWFGGSIALAQHLQIARMRALELERPFVRATNTGMTAVIDHHARVLSSLPALQQGVLEGRVAMRSGTTPFAWWASRWGLWPLWLLALGLWWGVEKHARRRRIAPTLRTA